VPPANVLPHKSTEREKSWNIIVNNAKYVFIFFAVLSVIAFVSAVAFLLPIAMIVIGKCFLRRFNRVEGVFFVSVVKFNA